MSDPRARAAFDAADSGDIGTPGLAQVALQGFGQAAGELAVAIRGPFYTGAKVLSATFSAVQKAATGPGSLSPSGLSAPGVGGLVVGGIGAAIKIGMGYSQAGQEGVLGSPIGAGRGRERLERQYGQESYANSWTRTAESLFTTLGLPGSDKMLDESLRTQRNRDEIRARQTTPADRAGASLSEFFAPAAAMGGQMSEEQVKKLAEYSVAKQKRIYEMEQSFRRAANKAAGVDADANSHDK